MTAPSSPCTDICRLDQNDICRGCGRRVEEIVEWPTASEARKHEIVAVARERLAVSRLRGAPTG